MENIIKTLSTLIATTLLTVFSSIILPMVLYVILFIFDVFFGIIADMAVHGKKFSTKKFFRAIELLLCYFVINFIVAAILYFTEAHRYIDDFIRAITIACSYFYGQNIFKNLTEIYPEVPFFKLVYRLISLEFIAKMPYLQKFIEYENLNKNKENKEDE